MSAAPSAVADIRRLTDLSRALTYAASLQEVMNLSVDCAIDLLGADKAVLALAGEEDGRLSIRASRGVPEETAARFREPLDETLIARLQGLFGPGAERRFLGVPLVVRGRVAGILAVDRGSGAATGDQEEWLLSALADQAAVALEGARGEQTRGALQDRVNRMEVGRRQTEQALRIASHDLRTPLGAMQGYLQLLTSGVYGPVSDAQREILERVVAGGRHLQAVLETVLELAHLVTADRRTDVEATDASAALRQAAALVDPAARKKGIRLRIDDDRAPRVSAHADWLRQVLVHLLDNAVKYSPPDTVVRLSAGEETDDDGARWGYITVSDQGPGIPAEHAEEAFLPSRRLAHVLTTDPGGSGLGLWIARVLVARMDGSVTLDPEEGPGATLRVRLPPAPDGS